MDLDITWIAAIAVMLGAGVLKGSVGFGAPLISVPGLALLVGPKAAVVLASVPLLVTNSSILLGMKTERGAVRRFLPALVVLVPATYVGATLLSAIPGGTASIIDGAVTVAFVVVTLLGRTLSVPRSVDSVAQAMLGAVAGLLNGVSSIPGPLFAMYLSTLSLDRRAFVYSVTLLLIVGNAAQVASYAALGLYTDGLFLTSALLAPAQLVGQQLGLRIHTRLRPRVFQRVVLAVVGISGANLLIRGLAAL